MEILSKNMKIHLEGPGIFYGGQVVQGLVHVSNSECISNVKNVQIKLIGFGEVHWTERKSNTRKSSDGERDEQYYETVHYRNHEDYISNKSILHQGPLAAGNHKFAFSFVLPPNLPSSFEGQYGHVRYFVEAKLDRSGFFTFNKRTKQFVTINSICDLNNIPGVNNPQTNSNTKTFGFLFWKSAPLSATLRIPRYGYTPGETIPISADVENLSDKRMNSTKVRFYQDVTFRATNGTKNTTKLLQEARQGPIGAHSVDYWDKHPLPIPAVPPTGLGGGGIIDVRYRLEFIVDPSGIGSKLTVSMPIMIGNIPLRSAFQPNVPAQPNQLDPGIIEWPENQQQTDNQEKLPESTEPPPPYQPYISNVLDVVQPSQSPSVHPLPPSGYADLPPPSYEDAIAAFEDGRNNQLRCDKDSEHTDANWDYTPKYPVWSMPSAPPQ